VRKEDVTVNNELTEEEPRGKENGLSGKTLREGGVTA